MSASADTRRPLQSRRPDIAGGRAGRVRITDRLTVSATMTPDAMAEGLAFCAERYERLYRTHWLVPPDVLFVVKRGERIVSTAALELGSKRPEIDTEKYFLLTPGMRAFIDRHRQKVVEFGRFVSDDWAGTRAVVRASMAFGRQTGAEFFFAIAPPSVYLHMREDFDVPLCAVDVPVNKSVVQNDASWSSPPVNYFDSDVPPSVIFGIAPFADVAHAKLDAEFGAPPSFFV